MTLELQAAIRDDAGESIGSLSLAQLPNRGDLLELHPDDECRLVVAEGGLYRFHIDIERVESAHVEPGDELFSFDDDSRLSGR